MTEPVRDNSYPRKSSNGVLELGQVKAIESDPKLDDIPGFMGFAARTAVGTKPLLTLEEEHDGILKQSGALIEALSQRAGNGNGHTSRKNVGRQNSKLEKLLTTHVRNEERVLLPIMSEHFDTEAADVIRREHAEILWNLRTLSSRISRPKPVRSQKSNDAMVVAATDFDSMIRSHFSREENVTYWFANLCLSKKGGLWYG